MSQEDLLSRLMTDQQKERTPMTMTHDQLLTVAQVAERLALKPATIRRMILERRIDVVRPSVRAVRVPLSAVEKIMEHGFRPALQRGDGQ
jgi:excisionase family DNA binding protein